MRIPKEYKNGFLQKCTVEIGIKKIKIKIDSKIDRMERNERNEMEMKCLKYTRKK